MPSSSVFVLLGHPRQNWPQPLTYWLSDGQLILDPVASVHEAAVAIVEKNIHTLLVDPAILTRRDVELLALLLRRTAIKILILPPADVPVEQTRAQELATHGALSWQDAATAFPTLLEKPDNPANTNGTTPTTKKVVTIPIPTCYDETESERLVSAAELHTLLGT